MKFIGIDLGTTNSVITSFDGKETRIWKSPDHQGDVTPSVIQINKRGGKIYGQRAYDNEPLDPNNTAKLFKRLMGTNTKIKFEYNNLEMTPEECSSEILSTLYGYLPEDVRNDKKTGVVITVPAAFNQMQKDATKQAAYTAGINRVALIQEPVAAILSVAKIQNIKGVFVVYDFGGGTFDISIADRVSNKVNLLTNDGIAFCGGRDFDKLIFDNVVVEWLYENFKLPENFRINDRYKKLLNMGIWATEKAKIELSSKEETRIILDESQIRCEDEDGKEIYLDISINREKYNNLIFPQIDETINKTREVIENAGIKNEDINHIVFVGGPSCYKPLRDRVSSSLGIPTSIDVNPMTAVSEGAAIYAESVDFKSEKGGQKKEREVIKSSTYGLEFRYNARISADKAKIAIVFKNASILNFTFKNIETGWTSGKMSLESGKIVTVDLNSDGENKFIVECYDENGKVQLDNDTIIVTKTLINIGNIPCAHSVGVELEDPITQKPILDYLIKKDDQLPKTGMVKYKTTKRISAGSSDFITFKLWEGEIAEPVEYNRFIGDIKVSGNDFEYGMIPVGSAIECNYTFNDSGNIDIKITVPSVGISLGGGNFYNRLSGQVDFESDEEIILDEAAEVLEKVEELNDNLYSEKLADVHKKLTEYLDKDELNTEEKQALFELSQEGKRVAASHMKENKQIVWQQKLDDDIETFAQFSEKATTTQKQQFEKLSSSIQRAIDSNSEMADKLLEDMGQLIAQAMFSDDRVFIAIFAEMQKNPQNFTNPVLYRQLIMEGMQAIQQGKLEDLKQIVGRLSGIMTRKEGSSIDEMLNRSGITK